MLYESEWRILNVLWREGPIPATEIVKLLAEEIGWNRNTTYTVLKRCVEKELVERTEPRFICRAIITKQQAQKQALLELVDRYFENKTEKMICFSLQDLKKEELKKIKKAVKKLEKSC